jgi:hypothetical protein
MIMIKFFFFFLKWCHEIQVELIIYFMIIINRLRKTCTHTHTRTKIFYLFLNNQISIQLFTGKKMQKKKKNSRYKLYHKTIVFGRIRKKKKQKRSSGENKNYLSY